MEFIEVLPTIVAIVLMAISIVCMILSMLGYMQLVLKVTNNTSKPEIKE